MSWWDTFTSWWGQANKPAYTPAQLEAIKKVQESQEFQVFKQEVNKSNLPTAYAAQVAAVKAYGENNAISPVLGGFQRATNEALYAPSRFVQEQIGAGALALATGKNWWEAKDLIQGDRPEDLPFYYSGTGGVSFGQSLYALGERVVPGEQGTEKIDWSNREQVQQYFSEGARKYITGSIDATAAVALDPQIWFGMGASKFRMSQIVNPVNTGKKLSAAVAQLDVAATGQPSQWTRVVDFVMNNPDAFKIVQHGTIFESSAAAPLASALAHYAKKGDRKTVAEIFKVALGDDAAKTRLLDRKDVVSGYLAKYDAMKADKTVFGALDNESRDTIEGAIKQLQSETDALTATVGFRDPVTGQVINQGSAASMWRTVSKIDAVERARVIAAQTRGKTGYFYNNIPAGDFVVRAVTWLNPSGLVKEAPAGIFDLTGTTAADSYKELLAVSRKVNDVTGIDYAPRISQYMGLVDEASRSTFLKKFEEDVVKDIIVARLKARRAPEGGLVKLTDQELQWVGILANRIGTKHRSLQNASFVRAARNNFLVFDDVTKQTFQFQQLQEVVERQAAAKGISVEKMLEQMESNPQFASQAVNTHVFVDTVELDRVIRENINIFDDFLQQAALKRSEIESGLQAIGAELTERKINAQVAKEIDRVLQSPMDKTFAEKATSRATEAYSGLVHLADAFYSTIWKPVTLLSPKYGIRNVLEGTNRNLVALNEIAQLTGVSRRDVYGDFLGNPIESTKTIVANAKIKAGGREAIKKAGTEGAKLRVVAEAQDVVVSTAIDNAYASMNKMRKNGTRFTTIKIPKDGSTKAIDDVNAFLKDPNQYISSIKSPEARRFIISLLDGDINTAQKIMNESNQISTLTYNIEIFRKFIDDASTDLLRIIDKGVYDRYLPKTQVAVIRDYADGLRLTADSLEIVSNARINAAAAWGEYSKLLEGTNPVIVRTGEGTFEVAPGAHVSDWAAGQLGKFARAETSADSTYANTILSGNRMIGEEALSTKLENVNLAPNDPNWARAYSDFVNQELRSDAVVYRILDGASIDDTIKYLRSDVGRTYRNQVGIPANEIENFAERTHALVEAYLPEIPNMQPGLLKTMAKNGEITVEKVSLIPVEYRPSVVGSDIKNLSGFQSAYNIWKNRVVPKLFQIFGSIPETTLSRHPFYRSVYRAEARRVARLLESQGVDLNTASAMDQIVRSAHRRARKELDQTLYTIVRRTDPAQALRFISPFYSAQQNSSRFWLGQAVKHPALPQLYIHAWNTPNKIFDVIDEDGNGVERSLPFFSNERIMITLPEPIAKLVGDDYVTISKTSMDLITNGQIPIIPQLSGAMVSIPFMSLMTNTNIQAALTDMGLPADFLEKVVLPYVNIQSTNVVDQIAPMPAWLRAFNNAQGGSPQAAARVDDYIKRKMMELEEKGITPTPKQYAKIIKDATAQAQKSYMFEMVFAAGSPFSTKLNNKMQLMKYEYYRYLEQYGPIEGPQKAAEEMGPVKYTYASSSLTENPGGLMSTPQTERNLKDNIELATQVATLGDDAFRILGLLFNEGENSDYSPAVSQRLYSTKLGGVELKSKSANFIDAQEEREQNLGWSYYIPLKEQITAIAESRGIAVGSSAWDATYQPAINAISDVLAKRYPAWGRAKTVINTGKVINTVRAMKLALNNEKFMDSIGEKKPLIQAINQWLTLRDQMAAILASRPTKTLSETGANADLYAARDLIAEQIASQYSDFGYVYERYFKNDPLELVG